MQPGAHHDQPTTEADPRPDLEQLDEALAIDVERLLNGSVEEVEQVLDGLFEETAAAALDARLPSRSAIPPAPSRERVDRPEAPDRSVSIPRPPAPVVDRTPPAASPDLRARAIRGVLGVINAPVHWLGPTGRRAVDWLAITLLLWVPVIWFIVLASRG